MSVYKVKPFLGDGGSSGGGSEIVDALPAQGVEGKTYLLRKMVDETTFKIYCILRDHRYILVNEHYDSENGNDLFLEDLIKIFNIDTLPENIDFVYNTDFNTPTEFEETYTEAIIVTSLDQIPQTDPGVDVLQDLGEITMSDFKFMQVYYEEDSTSYSDILCIFPDSIVNYTVIHNNTLEDHYRDIYYEPTGLIITDWNIESYTILGNLNNEIITDWSTLEQMEETDIYYISITPTYSYTEYVYDQGVYTEVSAKSEGGSKGYNNVVNILDIESDIMTLDKTTEEIYEMLNDGPVLFKNFRDPDRKEYSGLIIRGIYNQEADNYGFTIIPYIDYVELIYDNETDEWHYSHLA